MIITERTVRSVLNGLSVLLLSLPLGRVNLIRGQREPGRGNTQLSLRLLAAYCRRPKAKASLPFNDRVFQY